MRLNCFRAVPSDGMPVDALEAPRTPRKKAIRRSGTSNSSASVSSTCSSNGSISRLPPCRRDSDPRIQALMMPLPEEPRPSRCLRLSQPKTYSNIVDSMKKQKGCRDWRSFDVFYNDEVDMTISAEDVARRRAADYERKLRMLNSFSDDNQARRSIEVDMIG